MSLTKEEEFEAEVEKSKLCMLPFMDPMFPKPPYSATAPTVSVTKYFKKAEVEREAAIDAQRRQRKNLENQRDIEVLKLRVYTEEQSKEKSERCRPLPVQEPFVFSSDPLKFTD